jgi:rRNA maturation endonuclease Nob1
MHEQVDYVEFFATGDAVDGRYRCSDCSYGVSVHRELPLCPMCGGRVWEQLFEQPDEPQRLH